MVYISLEGIHPSWKPFFTPDVIRILENIDDMLIERQEPFNPNPENILRFAQQPLNEVKVLILGQDTYPAAGVATGCPVPAGQPEKHCKKPLWHLYRAGSVLLLLQGAGRHQRWLISHPPAG